MLIDISYVTSSCKYVITSTRSSRLDDFLLKKFPLSTTLAAHGIVWNLIQFGNSHDDKNRLDYVRCGMYWYAMWCVIKLTMVYFYFMIFFLRATYFWRWCNVNKYYKLYAFCKCIFGEKNNRFDMYVWCNVCIMYLCMCLCPSPVSTICWTWYKPWHRLAQFCQQV